MDRLGYARRFAAEQQDIVRGKGEIEIRSGGFGGEQNEAAPRRPPPSLEVRPGGVPGDGHGIEVVHSGAAKSAIGGWKSCRLDDVGLDSETPAQPQDGPGILRDVRLVQSNAHCGANLIFSRADHKFGSGVQPLLRCSGKGANRTPPECVAPGPSPDRGRAVLPPPKARSPMSRTGVTRGGLQRGRAVGKTNEVRPVTAFLMAAPAPRGFLPKTSTGLTTSSQA